MKIHKAALAEARLTGPREDEAAILNKLNKKTRTHRFSRNKKERLSEKPRRIKGRNARNQPCCLRVK